jgi:hypothetical protein
MPDSFSVADNLMLMRGVWHDHVVLMSPEGTLLDHDPHGGIPGPTPYENLVYVEFDGKIFRQTNVAIAGRPVHVRSFSGKIVEGILHFDPLGPEDPGHIGVAAGNGVLIFSPESIGESWMRYAEPDFIVVGGDRRTRNTLLYRGGELVRTLNAVGKRLTLDASRRHELDPRGVVGDVHETHSTTEVFKS